MAIRFQALLLSAARMRALAVLLAMLVLVGLQALWPAPMQAWNDRLTSRTWSWADHSTQERRVVVVDIDRKASRPWAPGPGRASAWPSCWAPLTSKAWA